MKIRKATHSDLPALVSLNTDVQNMHADAFPERFRRDPPAHAVERAFAATIDAPSSHWLVAVAEDEKPIGFIKGEFHDHEESWCLVSHRVCYLAGIVVAPGFRRQGIARALFAELQREADLRGVTLIELDVWAFNEPARKVFAKLGFQRLMEKMVLTLGKPDQIDGEN